MPDPNPAAFDFLAQRRSRPAKLMVPPVPDRDQLLSILAAATRVPDHGKLEPWRLVVLEKPALTRLADLAESCARATGGDAERIAKGRGQFDLGHLAVAVIAAPQPSDRIPAVEQLLSAGALCLGLLNAAEAAGWAANWLTGWPAHDREFITRAYGCTAAETVAGVIYIASFASAMPDRPRPDLGRIVTWVAR